MARKKDTGKFEEPDLVPILNLVCVLIPLVLWTTTLVTFGQITIVPGTEGDRTKGRVSDQKKLRLVAAVGSGSLTLMAGRDVSNEVMPPDETGVRGRIDLPHITTSLREIRDAQAGCQEPADPKAFNDCAYWAYMENFVSMCYGNPEGQVKVPDLKKFNISLTKIKDRVEEAFGDQLDDKDQINLTTEDEVPYCQIVGVIDFARFRRFHLDWEKDPEFKAGVDEAIARGIRDPFLDPKVWNAAMKRELLFPVVMFSQ